MNLRQINKGNKRRLVILWQNLIVLGASELLVLDMSYYYYFFERTEIDIENLNFHFVISIFFNNCYYV